MEFEKEIIHIARLIVKKNYNDATAIIKRSLTKLIKLRPDLANDAKSILSDINEISITRANQTTQSPLPVDLDSRLELLRRDATPKVDPNFNWPEPVQSELNNTISEREKINTLLDHNLLPTRSLLFIGKPGVGKTIAAHWLAEKLNKPLFTLDLSAVMSSYLGRTGNNIRVVLDYAKNYECVLLLDEFDAIAKRRDDSGEIGELKRLVTVLLQEIDNWPSSGMLIAATNHPELLDPAVWRRFDRVVEFPNPGLNEIYNLFKILLGSEYYKKHEILIESLAATYIDKSFADITKIINILKKDAIINSINLELLLEKSLSCQKETLGREDKIKIALSLIKSGYSERRACELIGASRATLRNRKKL